MKHKNQLPVSPENWQTIKANIPGIAHAAKGVQRTTVQTTTPKFANIEILNQRANHAASMRILNENGLRPVTYREILIALGRDPKLKEKLRGKWFWLNGERTEMQGFHTIQSNGFLKEGKSDDPVKNVYVWEGEQPLAFNVFEDIHTACGDAWFGIHAIYDPSKTAYVVVGIEKDPAVA